MSGTLNHSPAEVIRQLLIDQGEATHPDSDSTWPAFYSSLPDNPDNAIGVNDTTGVNSGKVHISGEMQIHYGVQIVVRGINPNISWRKANALFNALSAIKRVTVTVGTYGYTVMAITPREPIGYGGRDSVSVRRNHSVNCLVALREDDSVGT